MRVLLVEDDAMLGDAVHTSLAQSGADVQWVRDVAQARLALVEHGFHAVLLDLGLPDGDGSEILRRLRSPRRPGGDSHALPDPNTPVLILTARDQVRERIAGLDLGADDYLVKPFDIDELEARLRAMLRRAGGQAAPVIRHGELEVDPAARTVRRDGKLVEMSPREFSVLWVLLQARGRVLSRQQIEEHLYSWGTAVESNAVEVHIHHLRKKLGNASIVTMRGVGYFLPAENP